MNSYERDTFRNTINEFTSAGILAKLGIKPSDINYLFYKTQIDLIISQQAQITCMQLNSLLAEEFTKAVYKIPEYAAFPRYIESLINALVNPNQRGVYYDSSGRVQLKIIDTDLLGSLRDLQEAQHYAYPTRGALGIWVALYTGWEEGIEPMASQYIATINKRLDFLDARNMAPYWYFVEFGNLGYHAYPTHRGLGVIVNFRTTFKNAISDLYFTCVRLAELLIASRAQIVQPTTSKTFKIGGEKLNGYTVKTAGGKTLFVKAGTEFMDKLGRKVGSGFMLLGGKRIPWHGWIPK